MTGFVLVESCTPKQKALAEVSIKRHDNKIETEGEAHTDKEAVVQDVMVD